MNRSLKLIASLFGGMLMLQSFSSHADLAPPSGASSPPAQTAANGGKDLTPVQRPLAELTAPQSALKVTAWVDHPDKTYLFGEQVVLNVKTDQDAYVTVLDVGTSGKVHIIFPNQFQKNNRVLAGQVVQMGS